MESYFIDGHGGLIVRSLFRGRRLPGSNPDSTEDPPYMKACCTLNQTSSCWYGAKIPTLARPTQKGCKAGRGPAGRELPHQHVEDGIYWVQ
ncbi:hypothetical protein AVEN_164299-1 [Araneus ventricosus]|uniref:Uncharacterized protein n=1 Tax=Araneus ventricosus TaxID=182803 RepID=A0A4Y2GYZ8_ARAVE|nr:hypothetical protein AVEN_164299-1 [Araneus ventricosus]